MTAAAVISCTYNQLDRVSSGTGLAALPVGTHHTGWAGNVSSRLRFA
jgi:hypothetical protein